MAVNDNLGLFFNSNNGDRKYNADSMSNWLRKFFTTGVFQDEYQVTAEGGMVVGVGTGYANLDGKVLFTNEQLMFTLEPAHSQYPRIDNIVIERNDNDRLIEVKVVKGSYNGQSPTAPALVREEGIYQICLAQVRVNTGATMITQANITDTRPNAELCGWVVGTVDEIDLEQILSQSKAEFEQWFEHMKDQLDTDAAGHLQSEIDEINVRTASVETDSDGALHIDEGKNTHAVIGGYDNDATYNKVKFDVNDSNETLQNGLIFGTAKDRSNKFNDYLTTIARRFFIGAGENEESGETPRDASLFMRSSAKVQKEVMRGYGGNSGGIGVKVGAGGTTIVGGGEAADTILNSQYAYGGIQDGTREILALVSDTDVMVGAGYNTEVNGEDSFFSAAGHLSLAGDLKLFYSETYGDRKYANKYLMSEILANLVTARDFSADNQVVTKNSFKDVAISITAPSGYKTLWAVVGHQVFNATNNGANAWVCNTPVVWLNSATQAVVRVTNLYSADAKVKVTVKVLFIRDI